MHTKSKRQGILLVGVLLSFALAMPAWAGTVTVTPSTIAPGATVTATAMNLVPNDGNILALFPSGAPNSQAGQWGWVFLSGTQTTRSGVLTGGTWSPVLSTVGSYEVRAMHWVGTGYVTDATSLTVTVTVLLPPPPPPPPVVVLPSISLTTAGNGTGIVYGLFVTGPAMSAPTITIVPQAAQGSTFTGLSGDPRCIIGTITLTNIPLTCTAIFTSP